MATWFSRRFEAPTAAQVRGWEAIRSGRDTLIAAPTGSGKTLAAFLASIDDLLRQGLAGKLADATQVVYVSPLRALSNDIHVNLAEPRRGIRGMLEELGLPAVEIRAAVRTGDTSASERRAMLRRPPHILVTTPESLYLLLTSDGGREMLRDARTLIVDEIHAVADDRRGSHLALSMERLEELTGRELVRIGLSATQKPIEEVARFLVGTRGVDEDGDPRCTIIDEGHRRRLDLGLEIPDSPLEAVMSNEVWGAIYDRIVELIREHRTTLVFVNTRRLAERVTMELTERLGVDEVTAHHGSLSRELRLDAERRLKKGDLKALVATASLELGIDIGAVDLVVQIGTPRTIATFLQRVGRSGHALGATPKGRIFPLSRDELIECTALIRAARRGELDRLAIPEKPLDVLAQQIVAAAAVEDRDEDDLFDLVRRAYPYRELTRSEFDDVVRMLAEGFTTRRGRRGAHIHRDEVNGRIRGRRGARIAALTSGGAIPDVADYSVIVEPEGSFIGTVNEDFAIESLPGDIFQLGNLSWRILRIESGRLRVEDARGQPPTIPFWFGEAPERSPELSSAVSELRADIESRLDEPEAAIEWLVDELYVPRAAARQQVEYLAAAKRALGVLPTQECIVLERFFDEAGGMQLVVHAPFGSRINRAWGLALRKRFCRSFNFELEAAATEDAIVLSLSTSHSFPLEEVFGYLKPETARALLVQAMLDAPVFPTRWRWNATRALAVLRRRGGRRVPPPLQRMESDDLLASVFPDQVACLENIAGDREVPDHPLVNQTIEDCLIEAMNIEGLERLLLDMSTGAIRCVARDTAEPSPLAHEVLNARPYAFLDDVPLEERRTRAVYTRRSLEPSSADEVGGLDASAIERVRGEIWPDPRDADELHDALLTFGFLTADEVQRGHDGASWTPLLDELARAGRAGWLVTSGATGAPGIWVAAERLPELQAIFPGATMEPRLTVPANRRREWDEGSAMRELVRGRLELLGPTTGSKLAASLGLDVRPVEAALLALETEGFVLRGRFTPGGAELEWCERRLLARIHRYTLNRLRAEIEPVSAADFMRFLLVWSRVQPEENASGPEGLAAVIEILDGYELAAVAWEADVLASRLESYDPLWLDGLCLAGRVAWGRLSPPASHGGRGLGSGPIRSSPIALFRRDNLQSWLALAPTVEGIELSTEARQVLAALGHRGALFFGELVSESGLLPTRVEAALGELVAVGLVSADSYAGLRALLIPSSRRRPLERRGRRRRGKVAPFGVESAGRWSVFREAVARGEHERPVAGTRAWNDPDPEAVEAQAWSLLRRYGVVFRRLLERETNLAPWRELTRVYRRLEARGLIRGGRFVAGFSGEQFALPEAVGRLRAVRRQPPDGRLLAVSAADPLNLVGITTPGGRVAALAGNRVLYRDGVPVAAQEAGKVRIFAAVDGAGEREVNAALTRRPVPPQLKVYLAK
ncbi:MAG: DEAD/DEAH box helicase [Gemmatimonadetes bacterium]|uniref:DEAD/DEAH box helicase n=1 Tax=Candidatus Kutchimonas denitrificans TaxID=3056748 RepID=A0AAE4ZAZ6_9BACT|nr:DEAD/DEAH box helicase [Gemmatimonadota bacterium]NIR76333.1 DEAD/DEAH box helicase [Candidatus Kutchimonas denitrificans]NIS02356.1 DEAD/DEAH box helicase [Gemmatimonadota bacterium]NIT68175.1 DEAD/DEAH box helicase [Gemmatimonadota bacterium]NIU54399.1 DEAD/DEAH box helicase [Gemmatimonadota bacterium]